MLVNLPVQPQFLGTEHLRPIHAKVVLARSRVFGDNQGERDKMPTVHRPSLRDWKFGQIKRQAYTLALSLTLFSRGHRKCVPREWEGEPRAFDHGPNIWLHHGHHSVTHRSFMLGPKSPQCSVVGTEEIHRQGD